MGKKFLDGEEVSRWGRSFPVEKKFPGEEKFPGVEWKLISNL